MRTRENVAYTLAIADACHRYGVRWRNKYEVEDGRGILDFAPIETSAFPEGRWLVIHAVIGTEFEGDDEMLWYGPMVFARVKKEYDL